MRARQYQTHTHTNTHTHTRTRTTTHTRTHAHTHTHTSQTPDIALGSCILVNGEKVSSTAVILNGQFQMSNPS